MGSAEIYQYRKENHICVKCGLEDAVQGKTRCLRCAQIEAIRQAQYEYNYSDARKAERRQYMRTWIKNHPEKNREYQRRYRENEQLRYDLW